MKESKSGNPDPSSLLVRMAAMASKKGWKPSFQTRVFVSSAIAVLLVSGVGWSSYKIIGELIESNEWVNHAHEVEERVNQLSGLMSVSQSNARGYFITGQDYYLKRREKASSEVRQVIEEVRKLTADNPLQQRRLDQLEAFLGQARKRWEEVNKLYHTKGFSAIRDRMRGTEGKQRGEFRSELVQEMVGEEKRLLKERLQKSRIKSHAAIVTVALGCLTAILIVLVSAFMAILHVQRRRRAESSLTATTQTLQTLISSSPVGIIVFDGDLRVQLWSPACVSMFGWSESEVIGKVVPYVTAESLPEVKATIAQMMISKSKFEDEVDRVCKDGSVIKVSISAIPLVDKKGMVYGFMAILKDVTQRALMEEELKKSREEAIQASAVKSEFLANMSHEIRTPINGVIGMSGLLLESQLDAEQREYAETIQRSADSLLTVVNDILDFSKVEAGKLDIDKIEFDLNNVLSDLHRSMSFAAQKKGITLLMTGDRRWNTRFKGDPGRIQQVLNNLVSNAIKFTSVGRVVVKVSVVSENESSSEFKIEVSDTGIGIPQRAMSKMFKAFSQADASVTRRFGGTGLGLSICRRLVHLMYGEIGVTSEEGKGSIFWFTLPLEKGAEIQEVQVESGASESLAKGDALSIKILLAEDNIINQKVALKQLERMGCGVDVAANGNQVLQALERVSYDFILMDCQMPELDGYETARQIRASQKPYRDIPIIAVTANAIHGDKERCFQVGMDDYISKPIRLHELEKVIKKWSALARSRDDGQKLSRAA